MNLALLIITDGRTELLEQAIESAIDNLPPIFPWILVDDSGTRAAADHYNRFSYVASHTYRQGLAAAVRGGWRIARDEYDVDYLFHLEDDFTFNRPPDIEGMAALLEQEADLAQVSLKRQPVNAAEEAAGGFVQTNRDAYTECISDLALDAVWLEHRVCYSLNPHLAPRWVLDIGWPSGNEAEQTKNLNADPDNRFAIWGGVDDPPAVHHHGTTRAPGWKL